MVAVGENVSVGYWSWQNKENLWATWHAGQISLLDPRLMFLPSLQTDQSQSQRLATLSALQILLLALNYPTRPLSTCSHSNKTLFSSTVGKKDLQPENKKSFSCSAFNQQNTLPASPFVTLCLSLTFTPLSRRSHSYTIHKTGLCPVVGGSTESHCFLKVWGRRPGTSAASWMWQRWLKDEATELLRRFNLSSLSLIRRRISTLIWLQFKV